MNFIGKELTLSEPKKIIVMGTGEKCSLKKTALLQVNPCATS